MELICPAGTPSAFMEALAAGADAIYCGFRDETNARNFPGLNFSRQELEECVGAARARGVKTFVALNTFMRAGAEDIWYRAADDAARIGVDALILADLGLMAYVSERHPDQRLAFEMHRRRAALHRVIGAAAVVDREPHPVQ